MSLSVGAKVMLAFDWVMDSKRLDVKSVDIVQAGCIKNAVVLTWPMKYISIGGCSIYSTAHAVYIHFLGVYIG